MILAQTDFGFGDRIDALPAAFWMSALVWCFAVVFAFQRIRGALGLPMLAVLGTVAFWYYGDVFYNEYVETYIRTFSPDMVSDAWWQVTAFVGAFSMLAPWVHGKMNGRLLGRTSHIFRLILRGAGGERFQVGLTRIFWGVFSLWALLSFVAWIRLGEDIFAYFFPFYGRKAEPWARGRIGQSFDALIAFAGYLQVLVGSAFGVVAAMSNKPTVRTIAILGCLLTWPYYLFDRTRNTILATVIPGVLAWTFFRLRASLAVKLVILFCWMLAVESWLRFIIENRTEKTVATAFIEGAKAGEKEDSKHEGLNMFEELVWLNTFFADRVMRPNWGQRYFAELVNPIPRVLWPGKPLIGIDYAIARGQEGGAEGEAGVHASISTGLIGQGLQNFGILIGPIFAALLMAIWASALARLDMEEHQVGSTMLYLIGIVLTFNMGRDITLLTIYPFLFGWLLSWWLTRRTYKTQLATAVTGARRGGSRSRTLRLGPHTIKPPE